MSKILVVDDDPVFRKAASLAFTRKGHEVEATESGRDALAAVVREAADLVVLDLKMPAMDGVIFLQVLRSYLRWKTLPVIVVTGTIDDGELDRARALGIQGAYDKTKMEMSDVVACAEHLLSGAGDCAPDTTFHSLPSKPTG